jgi:membrane protease YdiL (CAAX protease family)
MQLPGVPAILFLAYLLFLLPWLAFRSHLLFRDAVEGKGALPPRQTIWTNTLFSQLLLLTFAWLIASAIGYPLFRMPERGLPAAAAGGVALAAYFLLRAIAGAIRTEEERRKLLVFAIAPRTPREWLLWSAAVLTAAVGEEAAYRGVGMTILRHALGNSAVAAVVASVAFALAHGTQGAKSVLIIFGMAIVMHVLVWYTGTLIVAMIVHAIYDFVAGYLIAREARVFDAAAAAPAVHSQ